jgi:hypothetical protein
MLGAVETRVGARWHKIAIVAIKPRPGANSVTILRQALASHGVKISDVGYMRDNETELETVTLQISVGANRKFDEMVTWLREVPEVKKLTVQ